MKATHNGHCQCCGRLQAVNPKLAKHGYTVDWGYFNGVCRGAGHLPLEVERTLTDATIVGLKKEVARVEAWIARGAEAVERIAVRIRKGRDVEEVLMTRDEILASKLETGAYTREIAETLTDLEFSRGQDTEIRKATRRAELMRQAAADLAELAAAIHGQALQERPQDVTRETERFTDKRAYWARKAQLEADRIPHRGRWMMRQGVGTITLL